MYLLQMQTLQFKHMLFQEVFYTPFHLKAIHIYTKLFSGLI